MPRMEATVRRRWIPILSLTQVRAAIVNAGASRA